MSKKQSSDTQTVRSNIQTGSTILLMGPTGSGKSAFVNLLTKDDSSRGGHDLEYHVKTSQYVDPQLGISVRLVDTPAFDDTRSNVSDTDVLATIASFLQEEDGQKVNGVLYFHRISEHRMGGPIKKNLKVFKELCGDNNFSHVRIITTNWNIVDEKDGKAREAALSNGPFKSLVKGGSKFVRHDHSVESARSIVNDFIHHDPFKLKIQEELDAGRTLGETSAGGVILEDIQAMQEKVEKEAEAVREEMLDATNQGYDAKIMEQERQKHEEAVERVLEERRKLETMRIEKGTGRAVSEKEKDEGTQKETTKKKTDPQSKRQEKQRKETKKSEAQTIPFPGQDQERGQQQAPKGQTIQMRHEASSLLYDMVDVVKHCSKAGGEQLGGLGKLFGALVGLAVVNGVAVGVAVGLWFSLVVTAKRMVLGGGN